MIPDELLKPSVTVAEASEAILGEGTCWDHTKGVLYWVDILQKQLHIYNPLSSTDEVYSVPEPVSAAVPTDKDSILLALKHRLVEFCPHSGKMTTVAEADEPDSNRFNDGKCDPLGRFWIGSMDEKGRPECGALYCFANNRLELKLSHIGISNGLAWKADCSQLFHIDTIQNTLCAYPLHGENAELGDPKLVMHNPFPKTHLDGMTIDEAGMLWIAVCGGGRIIRVNPNDGEILNQLLLPVKLPTNCAFGGAHLNELYVTSARETLTNADLEQYPLSGSVLRISNLKVRGIAEVAAIISIRNDSK